jgi:hypothetical protein
MRFIVLLLFGSSVWLIDMWFLSYLDDDPGGHRAWMVALPPSGGHLTLARPAPWSLASDDCSGYKQLASPHAPGFLAIECSCEAFRSEGACAAQRLGQLDICWGLGEEELRVVEPAWQLLCCRLRTRIECVEDAECHGVSPPFAFVGRTGIEKAADPGMGVRGLEVPAMVLL